MHLPPVTLVLGGARSGKSEFAEELAAEAPRPVYVATGEALDTEMALRIDHHRARRGPQWTTVEAPLDLVSVLAHEAGEERAVLVDCLTLWLSNLMHADRDLDAETEALVESLPALAGPVVFVSNEVGLGIVPENALARAFRDHAGRLNRAVAARAQRVYMVVAGIPTVIKDDF